MKIFGVYPVYEMLKEGKNKVVDMVVGESEEYILSVDEDSYIQHVVSEFSFDLIEFDWDAIEPTTEKKAIRSDQHPPGFDTRRRSSFVRRVLVYHLPFSGDPMLFTFEAGRYNPLAPEVEVKHNEITFEVILFRKNKEEIDDRVDEVISAIRQRHDNLNKELKQFNSSIEALARDCFRNRKNQTERELSFLASLKVPLKRITEYPKSVSIPIRKNKIVKKKPAARESEHEPYYELEERHYQEIVRICLAAGEAMERAPSTFFDQDEETLRDWFLTILSSHYDNSSGETFNLRGKTDILIREEGKTLFVAECKIWGGKKKFAEAIDQALGYLTWKNSKAAIICFVKKKGISRILGEIDGAMRVHETFLGAEDPDPVTKGRRDYRLHIPGDSALDVKMAVLCFHLPPK